MTNMAYSGFLKEIKKNNNGGGYFMKSNANPENIAIICSSVTTSESPAMISTGVFN